MAETFEFYAHNTQSLYGRGNAEQASKLTACMNQHRSLNRWRWRKVDEADRKVADRLSVRARMRPTHGWQTMVRTALRCASLEWFDLPWSSTGEWSLQISRWNGHAVSYEAYSAYFNRTYQDSVLRPHVSSLASVARRRMHTAGPT